MKADNKRTVHQVVLYTGYSLPLIGKTVFPTWVQISQDINLIANRTKKAQRSDKRKNFESSTQAL